MVLEDGTMPNFSYYILLYMTSTGRLCETIVSKYRVATEKLKGLKRISEQRNGGHLRDVVFHT